MLRQWRFVASVGIDLLGFLAQLVALRRLPLFAVQAMVAANLAVTAVLAAWLISVQLSWREWLAVAGVVVGVGPARLVGRGRGRAGGQRRRSSWPSSWPWRARPVPGCSPPGCRDPARTPVLGAVAGLGYGVLAVAARVLTGFSPATN